MPGFCTDQKIGSDNRNYGRRDLELYVFARAKAVEAIPSTDKLVARLTPRRSLSRQHHRHPPRKHLKRRKRLREPHGIAERRTQASPEGASEENEDYNDGAQILTDFAPKPRVARVSSTADSASDDEESLPLNVRALRASQVSTAEQRI